MSQLARVVYRDGMLLRSFTNVQFSHVLAGLMYYVYLMGTVHMPPVIPILRTCLATFVGVVASIIVLPVSTCLLPNTCGINSVFLLKFDMVRFLSG